MSTLGTLITRRTVMAAGALAAFAAGLGGCGAETGNGSNTGWAVPEIFDTAAPSDEDEPQAEQPEPSLAEQTLASMTREQKVAQLFCVTPEQLTGVTVATAAGDMTAEALERIPVGGLVYFGQNITGNQQLRDMLAHTHEMSCAAGAGVPAFLAVDEEGGPLVARVANSGYFDVPTFPNMGEIGATGDSSQAAEVGDAIGTYLSDIGFNLDFAPDADVLTNPENPVIGPRSFGSDSALPRWSPRW